MQKLLILVFCLFCTAFVLTQAQEAQNDRYLYIKEIVVSEHKLNGHAWDAGEKSKLPDIQVIISIHKDKKWKRLFTSPVFKDTLTLPAATSVKPSLPVGAQVQILVNDQDLAKGDVIGNYVLTIPEDTSVEEKKVSFDAVTSMVYFLSPYRSLEAHLLVLIEKMRKEKDGVQGVQQDKESQMRVLQKQLEETRVLQAAREKSFVREIATLKEQNDQLKQEVETGKKSSGDTTAQPDGDEAQKKLEAEKQKLSEEQKLLEEEYKKLEGSKQQIDEEQKKIEEEKQKLEEEKKQLENEKQQLEEEKQKLEEEKKKLEEEKQKRAARKAEAEKLQAASGQDEKKNEITAPADNGNDQPKSADQPTDVPVTTPANSDDTQAKPDVPVTAPTHDNNTRVEPPSNDTASTPAIKGLEEKQQTAELVISEMRNAIYEELQRTPYVKIALRIYRALLRQ
jgi:myosin heavy subunit